MGTWAGKQRLGLRENLLLSVYWFSLSFHWGALLPVVIPADVLRLVGDAEKARYLGLVAATGALVAMVAQPAFGAASDRCTHRLGRRRPFVAAGTVLNCVALLGMAYSPAVLPFALSFFLVQLSNNLSQGPYHALIPDLVPEEERGTASGFMGLMTMLGTIGGLGLAGLMVGRGLRVEFYWLMVVVMMAGMLLTLWGVPEVPNRRAPPFDLRRFLASFWIDPRLHPDFGWVFLTRALMMLAFYTLLDFLEYYLKDVLLLPDFVEATTLAGGAVMLGATASTLAAGWLSDRTGRKPLVFAAGMLMGLAALVFLSTTSFPLVLAFGVVFGLGYGAYTSVDWALAVDVLPEVRAAGKDLGLWSIAITLPQVIAPLIGGPILQAFRPVSLSLGYRILFGIAFLYSLAGSALVWKIRKAR